MMSRLHQVLFCVSSGQAHGTAASLQMGPWEVHHSAARSCTARGLLCVLVGVSVCVSKRDPHPAPMAVPWPPLHPKQPQAGGRVHPQKGAPAPIQASGHLGRQLWSPGSRAWPGRGPRHTSCALSESHSQRRGTQV